MASPVDSPFLSRSWQMPLETYFLGIVGDFSIALGLTALEHSPSAHDTSYHLPSRMNSMRWGWNAAAPSPRSRMINGKRVAFVMPAYNAEKTLEATVHELPDLVDIRLLLD